MKDSRRRRKIQGWSGGILLRKISKIWVSIWTEQETQIAAEITQNSGKILLFFMNKSWPIQGSFFVANVSHVSRKLWGNFSIK